MSCLNLEAILSCGVHVKESGSNGLADAMNCVGLVNTLGLFPISDRLFSCGRFL